MKLEASCHCKSVRFSFETKHPYPFNLCYCSICRKTAGGGGYAINLKGDYASLKIVGKKNCQVYHAKIKNPEDSKVWVSEGQRWFCKNCGSMLWVYDPNWPEMFHPFASAIDSDLPIPPERTHLMLEFKANWVLPDLGKKDLTFERYPDESIADWHKHHHLECV